MDKNIP